MQTPMWSLPSASYQLTIPRTPKTVLRCKCKSVENCGKKDISTPLHLILYLKTFLDRAQVKAKMGTWTYHWGQLHVYMHRIFLGVIQEQEESDRLSDEDSSHHEDGGTDYVDSDLSDVEELLHSEDVKLLQPLPPRTRQQDTWIILIWLVYFVLVWQYKNYVSDINP
ncbi:uncharacterized protein LOC144647400 [Oculina patagonica]